MVSDAGCAQTRRRCALVLLAVLLVPGACIALVSSKAHSTDLLRDDGVCSYISVMDISDNLMASGEDSRARARGRILLALRRNAVAVVPHFGFFPFSDAEPCRLDAASPRDRYGSGVHGAGMVARK
ncbi:MAG: hypothetical protein LBQ36_07930 [Synergistaceae bacterium]|nr:hypothetical protein [Synergistaceae bacterium]